ncbi:hypothetical protein HXV89_05865 [Bacillus subtilis]|uniref:hypothetical protein n=1 Tax=Bacillus subtilis TaxID=1423 RepID=UPI001EE10939|nr:hypothetical protein [Bacillus subtilis]
MEVAKKVELDGHKFLIVFNVDKSDVGWFVTNRLVRDMETNTIVYRESRSTLIHFVDKTLKEITIETAQHAVERIAFKEKDNEELQELRNWDGMIKSQ